MINFVLFIYLLPAIILNTQKFSVDSLVFQVFHYNIFQSKVVPCLNF